MTDNTQHLVKEIETAQLSLQENLQQIYLAVHPKNLVQKIKSSIKNFVTSPLFIIINTTLVTLVISSLIIKRKRTQRLIEAHKQTQKTIDAYRALEKTFNL